MRETESAARAVAKALLGKHEGNGARVVKNWRRADGIVTETVIFTETPSGADEGRVTIVPIDEAALCRRTPEYYRLESRTTINRLFRKYIEKVYLTPTELIHSYKALKKVQEVETLFPAAVDRVAAIQAKSVGEESKTRRDEVYRAVAQMTQKARRAEEHPGLPKLKDDDFGKVVERLAGIAPPDEIDYYALVVLSRELMQHRTWLGKLERLVELTRPDQREDVLALLDGVFADFFGVPSALKDVLGYQRNLAEALCAMADLWEGRFVAERSDARNQMAVLNPLLAEGRLSDTRKSLMDRLLRQLASGQALNRYDPAREREAFREVAERLYRPEGFLGGAATAEALTRRCVFLAEGGGDRALKDAIGQVVAMMSDSLFRVVYLCELSASPLGQKMLPEILACLRSLLQISGIGGLVPASWSHKDKMLRVTRIYDRLATTETLPAADRQQCLARLDALLTDYVRREGIIDKLDNPQASLRDRATRLLEFCAARVLPVGSRAHAQARQRVVELLKQPNFELRFLEGVENAARGEEMLRGLHTLLARGGFR
jgi:hypothetical protein